MSIDKATVTMPEPLLSEPCVQPTVGGDTLTARFLGVWYWIVAGRLFVHVFAPDEQVRARRELIEYVQGFLPQPVEGVPTSNPACIQEGGVLPRFEDPKELP
jgi:hypothetical protein